MNLVKTETETDITYQNADVTIVIKKDSGCVDVHQITDVECAGGQTWEILRDILDTKVGI